MVVVVVGEGASRGGSAREPIEDQAGVVLPLRQSDEQLRQLLAEHQVVVDLLALATAPLLALHCEPLAVVF